MTYAFRNHVFGRSLKEKKKKVTKPKWRGGWIGHRCFTAHLIYLYACIFSYPYFCELNEIPKCGQSLAGCNMSKFGVRTENKKKGRKREKAFSKEYNWQGGKYIACILLSLFLDCLEKNGIIFVKCPAVNRSLPSKTCKIP